ncbi:hypothetical protein AX16_008391 [Volvariella volvacea WC 439]|nr:hypothetical protein AX16_008391 [Volvariella volvacea WC 439]
MGEHSASKHSREYDKDKDYEKKSKKKRKHHDDSEDEHKKHKHKKKDKHRDRDRSRSRERRKDKSKSSSSHVKIVDDDPNDDDMWVEKNIDMDGERPLATDIPTAGSLKITSHSNPEPGEPQELPPSTKAETKLQRDEWMLLPTSIPTMGEPSTTRAGRVEVEDESLTEDYGESSSGKRTLGGGVDFFSSLGTEVRRKNVPPPKLNPDKPIISSKELNTDLKEGKQINFDEPPPPPKAITPGGPGSQWRMMRLRRVYESAEEEGRPIEEVGIERFGSLQAFEEAKEERRILAEREGKKADRGRPTERPTHFKSDGEKRIMFSDIHGSGASSRSSSFRRPGGHGESSTPTPPSGSSAPVNRRLDSLRLPSQAASPLQQSHTPVPSVMTPPIASSSKRALSPSSLNKLQAKVLRAKLMGDPNASALEKEYEEESRRSKGEVVEDGVRKKVEVLPTMDGRGRLYDVGLGRDDGKPLPGNRKKKEKFENRDPKTGEIIRYNPDDDTTTLGEMLRQEKFGAGMADQKNLDTQFAKAIMGDGKFQNDLEYMDDNAERLGRQKMRSDAMKRQFAIHDYKRTQKVLANCHFCYGEDDSPPKAPVIAMGTRAFLSCTTNEELIKGHCFIVPIQHHLSMLEADDDVWDEVRNFMKCLMRMYAEEDKGVIFYETVINLKWQKHTYIECVPVAWEHYEVLPGYFKQSILTSETEWSQHKKLIDFSARPGGFRRAMVPNLPYFMVQFDYKGEKGYGHVIEGTGHDGVEDEFGMDEGEKGGGEFPRWFAGEIIGNLLEIEARKWRRPRRIDFNFNKERVARFREKYEKFDWTGMIGRSLRCLSTTTTPPQLRRSYLYVPASSERMLQKSLSTPSDVIIYDLEDSVPPSATDKSSARMRLKEFLNQESVLPDPLRIAVRVNDITTPFFRHDIAEILQSRLISTIVLPKIHSAQDLHHVSDTIHAVVGGQSGRRPLRLVSSVESARALWNLGDIASWKSKHGPELGGTLSALLFAAEDFCADTSIVRTPSLRELLYSRSQLVIAAKAHGLEAIDMVCVNYKDLDTLGRECQDGRELGFTGKQAIHPSQVEVIQNTFVPTSKEILRAAKILHKMVVSHASGKGAAGLDGEMIDAPMIKQAEKVISTAKAAGLVIPAIE